jgi:SOS regulatory protein LexA
MKYLDIIVNFYQKKKRLPSYSEILSATGLKSKNSAHRLVMKLCEAGFLARDRAGKIIPGKKLRAIPILGTVEAGWPSPAEEELVDTITLDEYLINRREATYILRVQGESMIDAGIMPGDLLLVERGLDPKDGDIVVAEVDHEWTLKYFRKIKNKIFLAPANNKFKAIVPKEELKIGAVVVANVRKYMNK